MSTRTEAQIGAKSYNGAACYGCGTSYAACTERVLSVRRPCCSTCGHTDTHDEKPGRLTPGFPDALNVTAFARWVVSLHGEGILGGPYRGALDAWCEATGAPDDETALAWARELAARPGTITAAIAPF